MSTFPSPGEYARDASAKIEALAEDARFRRMESFEMLWNGTAHAERASFWDSTVPLRERRPAVQSGILRSAGSRLAHMVFGERSFPTIHVESQRFGVALDDAERDALSALVAEIVDAAKLKTRARAYLTEGLRTGTSVALCEVVAGKPSVRILPAKWCTPRLSASGRVEHLVIQYRYQSGETWLWYRRELGDGRDLVRAPVEVRDGEPIDWEKVAIREGCDRPLAFVPVVWTKCGGEAVEDGHTIDGHPLIEGIEDEVLALDMELSQLYRNALYNGEPQMVRTGVNAPNPMSGVPMGGGGRTAEDGAGSFSWLNSVLPKGWTFGGTKTAARKGPGQIWDLPQGCDAKLLESSGSGAQIIKAAIDEYRRIVTDSMGVVLADPQSLGGGELSARALTLMFGPMLDTASSLRVDYGEALCEIVDTLARLLLEQGEGAWVATLDGARGALGKLMRQRTDGNVAWVGIPARLAWGEFFEPSWGDVSAAIDAATKGNGGRPVLTQRAAMRLVAPIIGIEDIDAESEELAREDGANNDAMHATLASLSPADEPAPTAPEASVQDTALNGAQVEALVSLAEKVSAKTIPLETAVLIAVRGFQLSVDDARAMLAPAASFSATAVPTDVKPPAPIAPQVETPPAKGNEEPT